MSNSFAIRRFADAQWIIQRVHVYHSFWKKENVQKEQRCVFTLLFVQKENRKNKEVTYHPKDANSCLLLASFFVYAYKRRIYTAVLISIYMS